MSKSDTRPHPQYLTDAEFIYTCNVCHCHITCQNAVLSRAFQGMWGPAYLVSRVINVTVGAKEERLLMTGIHTVADITCSVCGAKLGWKYLRAVEEHQKYKEGCYIVEKAMLAKESVAWDQQD